MVGDTIYKIRGTKVTSPYPVSLTPAETRLVFALQKIFPPERIFADCYFPKPDIKPNYKSTANPHSKQSSTLSAAVNSGRMKSRVVSDAELLQVDCLTIDERGIFVFESKGHLGWIYGHGDRVHWTQVSAYGKNKHQFYNPIRQNAAHVDAIACIFGSLVPVYNLVVFGGDVVLKVLEDIPPDCHVCTQIQLKSTLAAIKSPRAPFSENQIADISAKIAASRVNPTAITRATHSSEAENAKMLDKT